MSVKTKPLQESTVFSLEDVKDSTLQYFNGDELATSVWIDKYAMKNKEDEFLEKTPDDMHKRMAREFAEVEEFYANTCSMNGSFKTLSAYGQARKKLTEEHVYYYFRNFKYIIPQGSVMSSLGNPHVIASLSNCIVLPEIYDSYGGIMYTDQQMAQLFKRRCGVGIDVSTLRPAGSQVSNSAKTTTGAISFMERFSNTTREVAQNGRRGALMITMDIKHPEIEEFIMVKQDLEKITGANISVRISDEFMEAVEQDSNFTLQWPIDAESPVFQKEVKAKELWNLIIKCAHNTAEPGVIFWDRQHHYSTSSVYPGFRNVSTNPCSEIAMQGGDSCRLMAINLFNLVEHPFTKKARFNYEKLYEVTYEGQRLMDDLVDLELKAIKNILGKIDQDDEPGYIKRIEKETWNLLYKSGKKGRRTGLGFTALADTIAALGYKFDSNDSTEVIDQIMKTKFEAEFESSIDMAIERGKFEVFNSEVEQTSEFVQMMENEFPELYYRMMTHGRRNISISTVAPTGSLSILAQTSSGIEPVFLLSYKRRKKVNPNDTESRVDFTDDMGDSWQEYTVYHKNLKSWMEVNDSKDLKKSPYYNATANDINWKQRVEIQSIIQKYTTHSISSTVNLPSDVSEEVVSDIYQYAWQKGLKGITVYRDGSRSGVMVSTEQEKMDKYIQDFLAPKRPEVLEARVIRFQNNNEKWIAVVGILSGRPYEIFTGRAEDSFVLPNWLESGWVIKSKLENKKSRYDFRYVDKEGYRTTIEGLSRSFNKEYWNYAKLISGVLRHGMPLPDVVDLVSNLNLFNDSINTWKNGVARALKQFVPDGTKLNDTPCPNCEDPDGLVYEEGCLKCKSCGYSKCG